MGLLTISEMNNVGVSIISTLRFICFLANFVMTPIFHATTWRCNFTMNREGD